MASTCPLIFKSSSPFTNPLGIVPSAPIIIDITIIMLQFFLVLIFVIIIIIIIIVVVVVVVVASFSHQL